MKLSQQDYDTIVASLERSLERAKVNGDTEEIIALDEALSAIDAIGVN